ncbi:MAG: DarT ssDNA thymidine ADP-ribosyltransferase family protein, partial [Pseudomonadota bacterium]
FKRNSDDPEQIERYQAEALVHQYLPIKGLLGIICYTDQIKLLIEKQIQQHNLNIDVHKRKDWYF